MTKPEIAERILNAIDHDAYPIPRCLYEDVRTVIVRELVRIEREEAKKSE